MKSQFIITLLTLLSLSASAQTDSLFQSVAKRLYDYYSYAPVEKIYLHQDRTTYLPGETVWFKIYQSSTENRINSGVVYVELNNGNNETVIKTKWELKDGSGSGHIELPNTLPMGVYQLRAYTNWMLNRYPEGLFTRDIIISSLSAEEWEVETDFELIANRLNVALRFSPAPKEKISYYLLLNDKASRSYPLELDAEREALLEIELAEKELAGEYPRFFIIKAGEVEKKFPVSFSPPVQISFFPEGGNLVAGILSKVAFKATDRNGKGVDVKGMITDESGNEIRSFETEHRGMGHFRFKPEAGKKYFAVWNGSGGKTELPEASSYGIVMNTKQWDENYRVTLWENGFGDDKQLSWPLYLTVHQDGLSWLNAQIEKEEDMAVVDIPVWKLPAGIFTITIYDRNNHAWCERLAFVNYPEQLPARLLTDRQKYGERQKVTVCLEGDGMALKEGDFSLAAVKSGLDDINRNNFYSDYFLKSELRGYIETPASYFARRDTVGRNNLDLLLLTHGWRRYEWKELMQADFPDLQFSIENSLTFSGKVHFFNKKQKMEDVDMTATFKHGSTVTEVVSFHPGPQGLFKFTGYHFNDTAEVILSAMDKKKNMLDISLIEQVGFPANYYNYGRGITKSGNDSIFVKLSGSMIRGVVKDIDKTVFDLPEVSVTAKSRKNEKIFNRLHNEEFAKTIFNIDPNFSYGGSISTLLLYVPGVVVGSMELEDLRVSGSLSMPGVQFYPVTFVLNGMVTTRESILTIPPDLIQKVEVLVGSSAALYSSDAMWGGVVAFSTRMPGSGGGMPVRTVAHRFPGYSQSKEFYSPDHAMVNKEYIDPDYRNTLYWQPKAVINNEGKAEISFYTSDEKGEYLIHCEGRSADGTIGVAYASIQVE